MTVEAAEPRSLLRRLYDWCLAAAHKPHALWTMGAVSFAESSFFPVPPDVMLIPMALARPERAYVMATWCTVTSVAGGLLGYAIGALLYDSVGAWLISLYGYGDKVEAFREAYAEWGAWIILLKGLTPIPYKIVTITSELLPLPRDLPVTTFGCLRGFRSSPAVPDFLCWRFSCTAMAIAPVILLKSDWAYGY